MQTQSVTRIHIRSAADVRKERRREGIGGYRELERIAVPHRSSTDFLCSMVANSEQSFFLAPLTISEVWRTGEMDRENAPSEQLSETVRKVGVHQMMSSAR